MAINFLKPVETDNYLNDVLTSIRDNIEAAVTCDYTGGTNIPDRAIQYNESVTPARWEKYVLSTTSWTSIDSSFGAGTIMLFGTSSAPTGWTRYTAWANDAMLVFSQASSSLGSGGSANPKDGHTHTGGAHAHGMSSHTHTGPSHSHDAGTYQFKTGYYTHLANYAFNLTGSTIQTWGLYNAAPTGSGIQLQYELNPTGSPEYTYTKDGTGNSGTGGTGSTGSPSVINTANGGTVSTGQNTTPIYQEIMAAEKD